ncbi:MAG: ArsR family transcriptional regulator [Candidatus Bathyarchaeia archaeon]
MKLERILASFSRQKILLALHNVGKTHLTNLVRIVNSTYNQVMPHLKILEKEGIISIKSYGRLRIVELNIENPRTKALLKALQILDRAESDA